MLDERFSFQGSNLQVAAGSNRSHNPGRKLLKMARLIQARRSDEAKNEVTVVRHPDNKLSAGAVATCPPSGTSTSGPMASTFRPGSKTTCSACS